MQISKSFPAICAFIFCSVMIVRAGDTPAQAAARAALEQKLSEMTTQPSAPPVIVTPSEVKVEPPAPVVVAPPAAPPLVPVPAPVEPVIQPAPAPFMVAAPAVLDTEAQARARAALLQKLSELGAQRAATPEKVLIEKTQTPPEAAPVLNEIKAPDSQIQTNSVAPVIMENKPAVVFEPVVKPIETPALPISATKEERLQALLEKYKADQITPEEYHTERAKIIGEP